MAFVITYRELRSPKSEGVCIVGSEQKLRETLERLGREGYEVTRITPPIRRMMSEDVGAKLDRTLSFNRPELKTLLAIWDERRQGRAMPAWAELSTFDLKAHLGNLFLVDVERKTMRFRYRLVGTKITNIVHRDVTGYYFENIYVGRLRDRLFEAFSSVVDDRAPLRIFNRAGHSRNIDYSYDCLLLPLSADGEAVNMVLGEMLFTKERTLRPIVE